MIISEQKKQISEEKRITKSKMKKDEFAVEFDRWSQKLDVKYDLIRCVTCRMKRTVSVSMAYVEWKKNRRVDIAERERKREWEMKWEKKRGENIFKIFSSELEWLIPTLLRAYKNILIRHGKSFHKRRSKIILHCWRDFCPRYETTLQVHSIYLILANVSREERRRRRWTRPKKKFKKEKKRETEK